MAEVGGEAPAKAGAMLGQKIGPMPAGAWLAVVAGGLGIGYLARRNRTPAAVPATDASNQAGGGIGYASTMPSSTDAAGMPKYGTSEEWIRAALGNLIGRGFVTDRVTNALNRIFYPSDSNRPTVEDAAIYNAAVAAIGAPPMLPTAYIPNAPSVTPPPTTTTPPVTPPPTVVPPTPVPNMTLRWVFDSTAGKWVQRAVVAGSYVPTSNPFVVAQTAPDRMV